MRKTTKPIFLRCFVFVVPVVSSTIFWLPFSFYRYSLSNGLLGIRVMFIPIVIPMATPIDSISTAIKMINDVMVF